MPLQVLYAKMVAAVAIVYLYLRLCSDVTLAKKSYARDPARVAYTPVVIRFLLILKLIVSGLAATDSVKQKLKTTK